MTEAKHTPGPWEVGTSPVRETLFVGSADAWICGELDNPNTPLETGEALANARLISAAPDMLAALKVHQLWEKREKEGPLYPFGMSRDSEGGEAIWRAWWEDQLNLCREAWELTDAAIVKATGAA